MALLATAKIQLWMGVFGLGLLVSLFWSRLYCGFICPINTVMEGISFVKKKGHKTTNELPTCLTLSQTYVNARFDYST